MRKRMVNIAVHMLPSFRKGQIKIPAVQREANVWTEEQKQLLIDSLFNCFDVPKIYCRDDEKDASVWWLIDGQQRVTAIEQFLKDQFALGSGSSLPAHLHGKKWSQLKPIDQAKISGQILDVVVITCDEDEEEDMFLRLNNGTPLSAAERRNAIKGKIRDMVAGLAQDSFFKKRANFNSKRFAHDAVCAQLVHLVISGGPTDAKGPALTAMYRKYREKFADEKRVATSVRTTLGWLSKLFPNREPYMKKFTVLSYFPFLIELKEKYAYREISNKELRRFFDEFEMQRSDNARLAPDDPRFDARMGAYQTACVDGPDKADSIKTRHEILLTRFFELHPDVARLELDGQRSFPAEMKEAIYLKASRRCAGVSGFACPKRNVDLTLDESEFDHIKEHAAGGRTSVINGQLLCRSCHAEKTRAFNAKRR
jgi:hypothetical protein